MNAFTNETILKAITDTAIPMMVYDSVFAACWVCRGSPRDVRYKKPAYNPIATDATEINHANQFTNFISTAVTVSAPMDDEHDTGENAPVAPRIFAINATMPGATRNNAIPMTVYSNILFANVAFCGSCPDSMKKNPASNVINTAMGGRNLLLIKSMILHRKSENVVMAVGAANICVVGTPIPPGTPI